MFLATTTATDLGASVGAISSNLVASLNGWIILVVGLYLGFFLIKKVIGFIPKSK
jgi:hypothetical protein